MGAPVERSLVVGVRGRQYAFRVSSVGGLIW